MGGESGGRYIASGEKGLSGREGVGETGKVVVELGGERLEGLLRGGAGVKVAEVEVDVGGACHIVKRAVVIVS